jgi:hypothetical protein
MLSIFSGIAAEALNFVGPLLAPFAWLVSPSFRARKRQRWAESRSRRIADIGLWFVVWLAVILGAAIVTASLSQT